MRNLKLPFLFLLLLTAIILLVVVWQPPNESETGEELVLQKDEEVEGDFTSPGSNLEEVRKLLASTGDVPTSDVSGERLIRSFSNAVNAQNAINAIDQAYLSNRDDLAKEMEILLRSRCENLDSESAQFNNWAYSEIVRYCDGWDSKGGAITKSRPLSTGTTLKSSRLLKSFAELSTDEFEVEFASKIVNADSPSDIDAGIIMLHFLQSNGTSIALGLPDSPVKDIDSISKYQRAALDIYGCYRFGGCGPKGFDTLEICAVTGYCEQGWDLLDFFENTMSPMEFGLAAETFFYLIGLESG